MYKMADYFNLFNRNRRYGVQSSCFLSILKRFHMKTTPVRKLISAVNWLFIDTKFPYDLISRAVNAYEKLLTGHTTRHEVGDFKSYILDTVPILSFLMISCFGRLRVYERLKQKKVLRFQVEICI